MMSGYDPFNRGPFPVGVRTFPVSDAERNREFTGEIWYPAARKHRGQDTDDDTADRFTAPLINKAQIQMAVRDAEAEPGTFPLIIFSHAALFHRRSASFLCTHLTSQGYVVSALDHSEVIAKELGPQKDETLEQRNERWQAVINARVPDVRILLEQIHSTTLSGAAAVDPTRIGIVGHSLGGHTALALPDVDLRIRSIVALAPAGASNPRPGVLPATLTFRWGRDIPTMYLVAENDVALPLSGMYELFERTPAARRMVILLRSDHAHFVDNIEELHEWARTMPASEDMAAMQKEMKPISELSNGEQAERFVRGLALCHFDATLKSYGPAQAFLDGDLQAELGKRGIDCRPVPDTKHALHKNIAR